ncbi:MAG TPA: hypothetical protein VHR86_05440, partial [Armatimonadota bacterium]|nr:hypothetical protein [Armatimonadota bacterium]
VAFSVGGVLSGSTATIPAGAAADSIRLVVQLPKAAQGPQISGLHRGNPFTTLPFAFGVLILPFSGKLGRAAGRRARRNGLWLALALVSLAGMMGLAGCGAMNSGYQAERHYSITVTATSGSVSHSTIINVVVR